MLGLIVSPDLVDLQNLQVHSVLDRLLVYWGEDEQNVSEFLNRQLSLLIFLGVKLVTLKNLFAAPCLHLIARIHDLNGEDNIVALSQNKVNFCLLFKLGSNCCETYGTLADCPGIEHQSGINWNVYHYVIFISISFLQVWWRTQIVTNVFHAFRLIILLRLRHIASRLLRTHPNEHFILA